MMHTLLAIHFEEAAWQRHGRQIEQELARYAADFVKIEFGLYIFKTVECAALIHWLEALCESNRISFVGTTLHEPPRLLAKQNVAEALAAIGIEVLNLSRKEGSS